MIDRAHDKSTRKHALIVRGYMSARVLTFHAIISTLLVHCNHCNKL